MTKGLLTRAFLRNFIKDLKNKTVMVKQFFKDTPNSVFFWNGLALLAFIILCCMGEDVAVGTLSALSFITFWAILVNLEDARHDDSKKVIGYHYWMYLSPTTWALILVGLLLGGLVHLGFQIAELVEKFNKYLNKK